jgi:hypothetical protein
MLQCLILEISKDPSPSNTTLFHCNIRKFFRFYPQFFRYELLYPKLGPVKIDRIYLAYCYAVCLADKNSWIVNYSLARTIAYSIDYLQGNTKADVIYILMVKLLKLSWDRVNHPRKKLFLYQRYLRVRLSSHSP